MFEVSRHWHCRHLWCRVTWGSAVGPEYVPSVPRLQRRTSHPWEGRVKAFRKIKFQRFQTYVIVELYGIHFFWERQFLYRSSSTSSSSSTRAAYVAEAQDGDPNLETIDEDNDNDEALDEQAVDDEAEGLKEMNTPRMTMSSSRMTRRRSIWSSWARSEVYIQEAWHQHRRVSRDR